METKICKKCNEEKEIKFFAKNKNSRLGCTNECLQCKANYLSEWRAPKRKYIFKADFPDEIWLPISGFETKYMVSNFGRIKSLKRIEIVGGIDRRMPERILTYGRKNKKLYPLTRLSNRKGEKLYAIHRLVAAAFIPNTENKPQVNHKDGNKWNNHVSNLEWVTQYENIIHAHLNGLVAKTYRGFDAYNAKIKKEDVPIIAQMRKDKISYSKIALHFGCCKKTILKFVLGRTYKS